MNTQAIQRAQFFAAVREQPFGGSLDQPQVDGLNAILGAAPAGQDPRWSAYMLATAFHETNQTMQPVREAYWLSEDWRKRHLRYYPFYGRGLVQLTWETGYKRAGDELGIDLVGNPELALDLGNAVRIMQRGMVEGWFTGRKLADYFSDTVNDPVEARRIINGTDRAELIEGYYANFLAALA